MAEALINKLWRCAYIPGRFKPFVPQSIVIYEDRIKGTGYDTIQNQSYDFEIPFLSIKELSITKGFKDVSGVKIGYNCKSSLLSNTQTRRYVSVFGYENCQIVIDSIQANINHYNEKLHKKAEEEAALAERQRQERILSQDFYDKCFEFHISKANNPYYTLHSDNCVLVALYIDECKGLHFLHINGNEKEETCSVIPYEKIHYYEKAGTIHYVSNTNGSVSSFGGSFTGSTFSKPAALISGLLFGPMGMIGGALFSSKPAHYETPTTTLDISSELQKIDERNVILNYYSDAHGQYIDIELPADIFNFLQTHLPDKKHAIVIELEKTVAVRDTIESLPPAQGTPKLQQPAASVSDDIDSFRQKAEKLKIMYEAGLITDEEFATQKAELMKQIL